MPRFVIPSVFEAIDRLSGPVQRMAGKVQGLAGAATITASRSSRAFESVSKHADRVTGSVFNIKNALVGLAAVAGLTGLVRTAWQWAQGIVEVGDELGETSKKLGVSTKAIQELRYASKLHNVDNETLTKSFEKLNKNLGDAHHGQGALTTALKTSNPALLKQLKHVKTTEEGFDILMAAIDKMPNQMDKASLAQAAFGKSGQSMLQLLADGKGGMDALRKEAQKYGAVLSDDAIKNAAAFDDAQDRLNFTMKGLKNTIGAELLPQLTLFAGKLTEWIGNNRELIKTKVAEFVTKISKGISWLIENVDTVVNGVKWFVIAMIVLKTVSMAAALAQGILGTVLFFTSKAFRAAKLAQWGLNAAMLASPVTWITLAIVALIGIIVYLCTQITGWGEQWDAVVKWMDAVIQAYKNSVILYFQLIGHAFLSMVDGIVSAWYWAQNKIGALSDEQYARNIAQINAEKKARLDAIKETAGKMQQYSKIALSGPDNKLQWKSDVEAKRQANNNYVNSFIAKQTALKEKALAQGDTKMADRIQVSIAAAQRKIQPKESGTLGSLMESLSSTMATPAAEVPKAEAVDLASARNEDMVQKLITSNTTTQKQTLDINIKDGSGGKAEVKQTGSNNGNIKLSSTLTPSFGN